MLNILTLATVHEREQPPDPRINLARTIFPVGVAKSLCPQTWIQPRIKYPLRRGL